LRRYSILISFSAAAAFGATAIAGDRLAFQDLRDWYVISARAADAGSSVSSVQLLTTQPDDGLGQLESQLRAATKTIDMTMYELLDTDIEQILADKAAQKVAVRVLLDHNREGNDNQPAYDFLGVHGVQVKWAPAQYAATHSKSISIDGATTLIMTNNLDTRYYATARDFGVVDIDAADNAAIAQVFDADFNGQPVTPPVTPNLIWSPTQSESAILKLIDSAQSTLAIENEEMADADVVAALAKAAGRGVQIRLIMTLFKEWADHFDQLAAAGVQIAVYDPDAPLYIHAKVILADYGTANQKLFIGSQNFSYDSLDQNRELGLTTTAPAILFSVDATLARDFHGGRRWQVDPPKR
jgi:phosphatidylserine/phosphatidylglycerophosphate/cardiolipin synthase-like enzyme